MTMADMHRIRSQWEVEREASEWIARLQSEDASEADRSAFEAWRRADLRNARTYEDMLRTWTQLANAGRLARAVNLGQVLNALTRDALARLPRAGSRRPGLLGLAVAAGLVMLMAAGVAMWWMSRAPSPTVFRTGVGEYVRIALPDGSSLELNSASEARVSYTDAARAIRLVRGEAYFKVAHDTQRPFWVGARSSWVRAVGTAFNVHVQSSNVRVTVSEGAVKVVSNAPSVDMPSDVLLERHSVAMLRAGQRVDMADAPTRTPAISLSPLEVERSSSWRSGTVSFDNRPLSEVVDELSRYTTLQIVIEDDELRTLTIGGTFQSGPRGAETLLKMLRDGFGVGVRREGNTVYIANAE
jgi:transmembrane sensor